MEYGWQELDARGRKSISVACTWGGLCPAVDCDGLMMMMMMDGIKTTKTYNKLLHIKGVRKS